MKEQDKLEQFFKDHKEDLDTAFPPEGHRERFLARLREEKQVREHESKGVRTIWKFMAAAAAVVLLLGAGLGYLRFSNTTQAPDPEFTRTQTYFAGLIEEQLILVEKEATPETTALISDARLQLDKLEADYQLLIQKLDEGGNEEMLLHAMITNYQTRISLLQQVLETIREVKAMRTISGASTV